MSSYDYKGYECDEGCGGPNGSVGYNWFIQYNTENLEKSPHIVDDFSPLFYKKELVGTIRVSWWPDPLLVFCLDRSVYYVFPFEFWKTYPGSP